MKKLSIIIPLFNVEKFVCRVAESIRSQVFDGLEVILVDDGSSDNSLEAAKAQLTGVDVKSIKQENTGPGGARNTGINEAAGEYLYFIDADDFLLPNALSNILKELEAHSPDVLLTRYVGWMPQKGFLPEKSYNFNPPATRKERTEYILGALPEPAWNVWRYVCRRSLVLDNKLFFKPSVYAQDVPWVLSLLESADTLAFLQEPIYAYYYRRPNSIVNTLGVKRLKDLNGLVGDLLKQYKDRPQLCGLLVQQPVLYINEYCALKRTERKKMRESYSRIFPLFRHSGRLFHRIIAKVYNRFFLYFFSVALFITKRINRKVKYG